MPSKPKNPKNTKKTSYIQNLEKTFFYVATNKNRDQQAKVDKNG